MNKSQFLGALCAAVGSLLIAPTAWAVSAYSQNFEGLSQSDPTALSDDGWLVYGNVYDTGGTLLYSHGPHPAPNNQGAPAAFSDIASGEGGIGQGGRQLSVFSDYQNGDHGAGNLIESIVYQEQTIGAGDIGITWAFSFDAKLGNLLAPSTASAFIRIIDPNNGYALASEQALNMTNTPSTWAEDQVIQMLIEPSMVGSLFQIGFANIATNYDGSSILYDNIELKAVPIPAAAWLFGSGLLGLVGIARRKKA